jgi:hypothetical protein
MQDRLLEVLVLALVRERLYRATVCSRYFSGIF